MKFKTLTVAAVAALFAMPTLAAPTTNGKLIGNGINTPREYVPGKTGVQRRKEIVRWLYERGGKYKRECVPKERHCRETMVLVLKDGSALVVSEYRYTGQDQLFSSYCRSNTTVDSSFCYHFENEKYFSTMRDTKTGKWEQVWQEDEDENTSTHEKTVSDDIL